MTWWRRRDAEEEGAALVETAAIMGFLLMIALGAFEYGMAFQSWFGVSAASREGARVGASVGPTVDADCRILEAVAAALQSTSSDEVKQVTVFDHDPSTGTDGVYNAYRPFDPETDDPDNLMCTSWFIMGGSSWTETSRDNEGDDRDWIGVEVEFSHNWITDFRWWSGRVDWSNRSIMRIEPVNYG